MNNIIGYKDFIKTSWRQTWERKDLIKWTTLFFVIATVLPTLPFFISSEGDLDINIEIVTGFTITGLISTILTLGVMFSLVEAVRTGKSLRSSWKAVKDDFWSYLWPSILMGASILSLMLIALMVLVGAYEIPALGVILTILAGFGLIALSFYTTLYLVIRNAEDLRGIDTIVRSVSLVKDYWWAVFGRLLIFIAIAFIINIILGAIVSAFVAILGYDITDGTATNSDLIAELVLSVTAGLSQGIVMVMMFFGLFKIYEELKTVKSTPVFVRDEHPRLRKFFIITAWMAPALFVILIIADPIQLQNIQDYFTVLEMSETIGTTELENINWEEINFNE